MGKSQLRLLTQHAKKGVVILTFTASLLKADAVTEALTVINASKNQKFVLDCQSVRFLVSGSLLPDQEPLTPLLDLRRQLAQNGGVVVLCNLVPEIYEVFRITHLDQLFEIQPDVNSAVSYLTS